MIAENLHSLQIGSGFANSANFYAQTIAKDMGNIGGYVISIG
jgi:hypothetical protein